MDTNAIIECFRLRCWNGIADAFALETTPECVVECATGNRSKAGYTEIDIEQVRSLASVEAVDSDSMLRMNIRLAALQGIDPGEAEILALMLASPEARLVCSPDKACIRGLNALGLLDRAVALEELGKLAGLRVDLRYNFTNKWLSEFRSNLIFESL